MIDSRLNGIGMTSARTRERLVQRLRENGIRNPSVLDRIRSVPRHLFVDEALASRAVDDGETPTGELAPDVLLKAARESEELLERGTPANAVVAAWVRLEEAASGAGVRADRSRTSAKLARTVLRTFAVDEVALEQLAGLYREARFSSHEIGEDMRDQARVALGQVTRDLTRALPASSRTRPPTGSIR